ncbi:hypothetical protein Val02_36440 [Virgisporangium aliadipatigenens]|uniref:Sulfotransferase domain-containing protein n=1 Tax=Virgisporangium aliadipatigenens TaxID=741659 RepID=A0A8J3YMD4_9ACTN|nr:hypothetical protein Val02_36440 [Virgisporangium aliadipatigenens]
MAVVRYEDLHADPVAGFARMAATAGLATTPDRVAAAVAATRFARLRGLEAAHGFPERPAAATTFFRRGAVGGWRDDLPAHLARRIERAHGEAMADLGYL